MDDDGPNEYYDDDDDDDYSIEDILNEDDDDDEEENEEENKEEEEDIIYSGEEEVEVENKNLGKIYISDYDLTLSKYEFPVIISSRAKIISNGGKSFLSQTDIEEKNLTSSLSIAEEEFERGLLKFHIRRTKPNGMVINITEKNYIKSF
jgi:DNA-directed RNA polymerase subunit K/omega